MPSKTDFNVAPYYDDFSESKKFHRVMYRPAFAVQARELTTQQSIQQNQLEKLGDSIYRHGAMVIPGEATYDLNYYAVKLTSFTGTLANYKDNTLTGGTSGVVADVVNFVATDGTDPDTLYVVYNNSGTNNTTQAFANGETVTGGSGGRGGYYGESGVDTTAPGRPGRGGAAINRVGSNSYDLYGTVNSNTVKGAVNR